LAVAFDVLATMRAGAFKVAHVHLMRCSVACPMGFIDEAAADHFVVPRIPAKG
jgi:hypothetical protein